MNLRSTLAIARKDAVDIVMNKTTLMGLLTPIFIALVYAFFGSVFGETNYELLIYNPSNSNMEKALVSYYPHAKITRAASSQEVSDTFGPDGSKKQTKYVLGLSIPNDFDTTLNQGQKPNLTIFLNGDLGVDDPTRNAITSLANNYANAVTNPQPLNLQLSLINPPDTSSPPVADVLQSLFGIMGILFSLMIGLTLVPTMLVEEKEKKTLRMLMVSPASFADIIAAKLLVGLIYQLILVFVVVLVLKSLTGNIPLLILFILIGSAMSISIGLIVGCVFQTSSSIGAFTGTLGMFFFFPGFFAGGALSTMLQNNSVANAIKILPTYYLAEGMFQAADNQGFNPTVLLDLGVCLTLTFILFITASYLLRRQSSIIASI